MNGSYGGMRGLFDGPGPGGGDVGSYGGTGVPVDEPGPGGGVVGSVGVGDVGVFGLPLIEVIGFVLVVLGELDPPVAPEGFKIDPNGELTDTVSVGERLPIDDEPKRPSGLNPGVLIDGMLERPPADVLPPRPLPTIPKSPPTPPMPPSAVVYWVDVSPGLGPV